VSSTTRMLSAQHGLSFYFVTAILPRDLPASKCCNHGVNEAITELQF